MRGVSCAGDPGPVFFDLEQRHPSGAPTAESATSLPPGGVNPSAFPSTFPTILPSFSSEVPVDGAD